MPRLSPIRPLASVRLLVNHHVEHLLNHRLDMLRELASVGIPPSIHDFPLLGGSSGEKERSGAIAEGRRLLEK
jgi:hypothetical protein